MAALRLLLQLVLGIGLTYLVQRLDKARLSDEQRDRAWNNVTWCVSLWWFGPLSMFGWGWVTRRGRGLLYGGVGVVLLSLTLRAIDLLFALVCGLPLDLDAEVFGS